MSKLFTILRKDDPDCLLGNPWGHERLKAAVRAFNEALGLEHPQYVLEFVGGCVVAPFADEGILHEESALGIAAGLGQAARHVLQAAGEAYIESHNDTASTLRALGRELQTKAEEAKPTKET